MFVIGIAGGSGSGKSTIVQELLRGDQQHRIAYVPHDAYYRNLEDMAEEMRASRNWDHPDALDNQLFLTHIDRLRAGEGVACPVYDFSTHKRSQEILWVEPRPILLLEGLLLLAIPAIRERLDLRVYVDTPSDLRIVRRFLRDMRDRSRTAHDVAEQYIQSVRVMHEEFVEPSRRYADVIIPWEWHNPQGVELLRTVIERN